MLAVMMVALAAVAACGPSRPSSPDFGLVAYQGEGVLGTGKTNLAHVLHEGRPVVLNFFAGNCPACRVEMPGFEEVSEAYRGRVIFLGVDLGPFVGMGSHRDSAQLLSDLGITYPSAYALDDRPVQLYNVTGMPTTIFFDRKGNIVQESTGALSTGEVKELVARIAGE